jgi:8-oxo-dGTP pyrophosphatase MutT (NUDIX family)
VDTRQDESTQITAIRETFEESGLLLASATTHPSTPLSVHVLDTARHTIHERKQLFRTFLAAHRLNADTDSLLPFTQWITPPNALRYVSSLLILSMKTLIDQQAVPYPVLRRVPPCCFFVRILLGSQATADPETW